ncbi:MAG: nucleotidyltransferase domain-containing protein [Oscillospiraceae bacterium]|nr:nucleotidyltransferase domain-containing protein [Oscillospiraceae bacterium]
MQKAIEYLKEQYRPLAIVTYGSFSCGLNDAYSDFDCMVIVDQKERSHDDTIIDGIPLDCFIFT